MVYKKRIKKKWQMETDSNPDTDPLHTSLFRKVLVDGLPDRVKGISLEDVMGLTYKTKAEFCEHLTHAVDKYRKEDKRQEEQEREILR